MTIFYLIQFECKSKPLSFCRTNRLLLRHMRRALAGQFALRNTPVRVLILIAVTITKNEFYFLLAAAAAPPAADEMLFAVVAVVGAAPAAEPLPAAEYIFTAF